MKIGPRRHLWWHYPKTGETRCLSCHVPKTRTNYLAFCPGPPNEPFVMPGTPDAPPTADAAAATQPELL